MIKVYKLNKLYNKKKRNEIHVLKDVTIEFPKTGLVFLLGPSGSGKSTLLNAIGGLDRVDSGNISIDDKTMDKYRFKKWDELRNQHIGYIFQNYNLFPDLSVYDNILFALRLIGIKKGEAEERIEYALKAVKMEKHKKRKVKNLSGGQQQRVAIARALVKSPDVIIADEPTGNLDANNTTQIMNIIKKISKNCLVVMVTHELRLANFYGDRIIEIKDGTIINDYINTKTEELTGTDDRNIYLQELNTEVISEDDLSINYFYQDDKFKGKINVIFKDNILYLHTFDSNVQIKLLTKGDEVQVIDGKKAPINKESIEDTNYSLTKVEMGKRHSVISLQEAIRMAFTRLRNLRWFQKLFFMSFALIAIMLVMAVATFVGAFKFDDRKIVYEDRNYLYINTKAKLDVTNEMVEKYWDTIGKYGIKEYFAKNDYSFYMKYDMYHQAGKNRFGFTGSLVSLDLLNPNDLLYGSMPTEKGDIVLDKWVIDNMIVDTEITLVGLFSYEDFIGKVYTYFDREIGKIVGVADTNSPSVYVDRSMRSQMILTNFRWIQDYYLDEVGYEGTLQSGEILVNKNYNVNSDIFIVGDYVFTIIGEFADDEVQVIFNETDYEKMVLRQMLALGNFGVYSVDKEATEAYFETLDFTVYDKNLVNRNEYLSKYQAQLVSQAIFTIVVLLGSLLFMYLMMRSSLFSRVYEIGVYRALGVTRKDIYKIFVCEITIITLITSFLGWLLTTVIIQQTIGNINVNYLSVPIHIYYPIPLAILTLAFIYGINLFNGLLPINGLLRNTPAQILSKYDI